MVFKFIKIILLVFVVFFTYTFKARAVVVSTVAGTSSNWSTVHFSRSGVVVCQYWPCDSHITVSGTSYSGPMWSCECGGVSLSYTKNVYKYQISNLSASLDVFSSTNLNIEIGTANGLTGNNIVTLKKSGSYIADVNIEMSADRNWSTLQADLSLVDYKSYVSNLDSVQGSVNGTFDLYIPKRVDDDQVIYCKDVLSLADVNKDCINKYEILLGDTKSINNKNVTASVVNFNSVDYWKLSGLSTTGGAYSFKFLEPLTVDIPILTDTICKDNSINVNSISNINYNSAIRSVTDSNLFIYRDSNPPRVNQTDFSSYPGNNFVSKDLAYLNVYKNQINEKTYYSHWVNRCNNKVGEDNCSKSVGGLSQINDSNLPEVVDSTRNYVFKFNFSDQKKADVCTIAQLHAFVGLDTFDINKLARQNLLKIFYDKSDFINYWVVEQGKTEQDKIFDICYLENDDSGNILKIPESVDGVRLEYDVSDFRMPIDTNRFVSRYVEIAKAKGLEVILNTGEFGRNDGSGAYLSGINKWNANKLLGVLDKVYVRYEPNKTDTTDVDQNLNKQINILNPLNPQDCSKLVTLVDLKNSNSTQVDSISSYVRKNRLYGVNLWENGEVVPVFNQQQTEFGRGGQNNILRKILCMSHRYCQF